MSNETLCFFFSNAIYQKLPNQTFYVNKIWIVEEIVIKWSILTMYDYSK